MANTSKHKGCTNGCTCGSPGGCDRYHCLFCNGVPWKFVLDTTETFEFGVTLVAGTWANNQTDWVQNSALPGISDDVCTAMWKLRSITDTVITGYKFTTQILGTVSQGNVNYDAGKVTVVFRHDVYEETSPGVYTLIGHIVFTRIFDNDYPCDCTDKTAQVEIPVLSTVWQIYDATFTLITSGALFDEIDGIKSNVPYQFSDCQHYNLTVTTDVCPLCMPAVYKAEASNYQASCKCFDTDGCEQSTGPDRTITISVFGVNTDYTLGCGDADIGPVLIDEDVGTGAEINATIGYWVTTVTVTVTVAGPSLLQRSVGLAFSQDTIALPAYFDEDGNVCGYPAVVTRYSCDQIGGGTSGQCLKFTPPGGSPVTTSCAQAEADGLLNATTLEDYIISWSFP